MIPVIESLPEAIVVNGREYSIASDFRDWMRFEMALRDEVLTEEERLGIMLGFFYPEEGLPDRLEEALQALARFFLCGAESKAGKQEGAAPSRVYDYMQDGPMIYAAFLQAYSIDLHDVEYLHWWAFRALMDGLPESTRMAQIMGIRAADTRGMTKEEKARYARLKELFAIGASHDRQQKTLEQRNAELLERARRARERAKGG